MYREIGYKYTGTQSHWNITADRVENGETKTRFHVSVYGDTITYNDLELYNILLWEFFRNFRVRKNLQPWLNISLIASYEPIAMTIIKKRHQSMFQTSVKLDGSTIYHGLGDFESKDKPHLKDIRARKSLLPEFFVLKIRSKEDIRTRLAVIFDFIKEKADVFETIRDLQPRLTYRYT